MLESKTVIYLFTNISSQQEVEIQNIPLQEFKKGKVVKIPSIQRGHIVSYYVNDIVVQNNRSQIILHIKLLPL